MEVDGVFLYMLHDVNELDLDPVAADFHVVVSGHSHRPSVTQEHGVLFLNPGSAGRHRFRLPVTVARLVVRAGRPYAEIIELPVELARQGAVLIGRAVEESALYQAIQTSSGPW